jgi:ABC-2 type transport system permease protein
MSFSRARSFIVAKREYLTTVRRKAFLFTLLGVPLYFGLVMTIAIRTGSSERQTAMQNFTTLGVTDSTGIFLDAPRVITTRVRADRFSDSRETRTYRTEISFYPDQSSLEDALRSDQVTQGLVIPADYLETGGLRRYVRSRGVFGASVTSVRPIERWLVRSLLGGRAESLRVERAARPSRELAIYTLSREGRFEADNPRREMLGFLLPFLFAALMGAAIVTGGQYLLQGVSEEKESRILESLLCTLSAEDLLVGKLLGLGAAGLTLVGAWILSAVALAGPTLAVAQTPLEPGLLALGVLYFLLGYLFYASLMTGIGAITNNMREAQQFSFIFTFANFLPMVLVAPILARPEGPLALILSLLPITSAVTMMMRLAVPASHVPTWHVVASIALLAVGGWLSLVVSARIFRIGLLLYGKTPNLPEILRWARAGR